MILYDEISVVIQGPIYKSNDRYTNITKKVCESVRKYLPGAEIIVSTWEGDDYDDLDFDQIVINKKIEANNIRMPYSGKLKLYSVNHQLITTIKGIEKATRKYVLKLRSDLSLTGTGFLEYFDVYREYPDSECYSNWKIFNKRIITLPTYNIYLCNGMPYNICDWFFFGEKEDVRNYFDIPLIDTFNLITRPGEKYPRVDDNFGAEQIMWISCLRKYREINIKNAFDKTGDIPIDYEASLANNFVLVSASQASLLSLSYGVGAYAVEPYFSRGLYSLEEWEKLYNKYGGGHIRVKYRFKEHILGALYNCKEYLCNNNKFISKYYYKVSKKLNKKRIK